MDDREPGPIRHSQRSHRAHARVACGVLAAGLLGVVLAGSALAQAPDVRDIKPVMMLLVDTSGSMERLPDCVCGEDDPACLACLPDCATGQRNRWAVTLEALTGSFEDYECAALERRVTSESAAEGVTFSYDLGYYLPYHKPKFARQADDGVLDAYIDRVKFGLMTFDGMPTWFGESPLVPVYQFSETRSGSEDGLWSYGGARDFDYPGCATAYRMDTGVRGSEADEGALISVGNERRTGFDLSAINASIQDSLLTVRPFGGTPIAAALDDLRQYFKHGEDVSDGVDPYYGCRERYALLISDGYPDDDFRDIGCLDASDSTTCGCDVPGYTCPYPTPEEAAAELKCGPGSEPTADDAPSCASGSGYLDKLFVVGFNVADDPEAIERLNAIALNGGSEEAKLANDLSELRATLAEALDSVATSATTRTVPAYATGLSGSQYEFSAGFEVGQGNDPWKGVLERRRFECAGGDFAEPMPIETRDRFHLTLQGKERWLWSVLPTNHDVDAHLYRGESLAPCGELGCERADFDPDQGSSTPYTPERLGLASGQGERRTEIMKWVHATSDSARADHRLGDIYHSSPVVVDRPAFGSADQSYRAFRQSQVSNRPAVVYVGSNDGILHAFSVEDWQPSAGGADSVHVALTEGEEIWGFIPPMLLPKLEAAMGSHQYMVDGTPAVAEVFFERTAIDPFEVEDFHTVLVSGLRAGGRGFFALDVTDPHDPEFLWQLVDDDDPDADDFDGTQMGLTYGKPAIGRMYVEPDGREAAVRAVAILPGGKGELQSEEPADSWRRNGRPRDTLEHVEGNESGARYPHRSQVRDWGPQGRSLYVVDLGTGELLGEIGQDVFPSPLVGGVSAYSTVGDAPITRAFVTDADGVIWRVDFNDPDPDEWTAAPFHDMFFDEQGADAHRIGQPSYEPPVLSVDDHGRLVIIQATGDTDNLETGAINRVVSLTEKLPTDSSTYEPLEVEALLNWTMALEEGESVTGPVQLLNGVVYFASFTSVTGADACSFGESILHAYDFVESDEANPPAPVQPEDMDLPEPFRTPTTNELFLGVGIRQHGAQSCYQQEHIDDVYVSGQMPLSPTTGTASHELVLHVGGGERRGNGSISTMRVNAPGAVGNFTRIEAWIPSVE